MLALPGEATMRFADRAWACGLGLCCLIVSAGGTGAQDAGTALPKNYQTVFENGAVEVIHVHYGPHEKVPMHDHSANPTVYVYLSDSGPVRFTHEESGGAANAGVLTRPPIKAGAFRVSPGRRERHSVENLGAIPSDFLRVELRGVNFGVLEPFRGEAAKDLARSATTIEVKTATLEIDRVVCAGDATCVLDEKSGGSLLVLFTPAEVSSAGRGTATIAAGGVQWIKAGAPARVRAEHQGQTQMLRIVLLGAKS